MLNLNYVWYGIVWYRMVSYGIVSGLMEANKLQPSSQAKKPSHKPSQREKRYSKEKVALTFFDWRLFTVLPASDQRRAGRAGPYATGSQTLFGAGGYLGGYKYVQFLLDLENDDTPLMKTMANAACSQGIANDSLVPPRSASISYDVWVQASIP
jgi:hypothetical protein